MKKLLLAGLILLSTSFAFGMERERQEFRQFLSSQGEEFGSFELLTSATFNNQKPAPETTTLTHVKDSIKFEEKVNCLICRYLIESEEFRLSCRHNNMHFACLARWMEMKEVPTCPTCRRIIIEAKL